jgi:hypothetical protein
MVNMAIRNVTKGQANADMVKAVRGDGTEQIKQQTAISRGTAEQRLAITKLRRERVKELQEAGRG